MQGPGGLPSWFYTFVKNAYPFKDDDCICRMCEARFRKSLEMSHDTEATSSKRKCIFDKSIKQWLISPL
jgi:hypothetical protein